MSVRLSLCWLVTRKGATMPDEDQIGLLDSAVLNGPGIVLGIIAAAYILAALEAVFGM